MQQGKLWGMILGFCLVFAAGFAAPAAAQSEASLKSALEDRYVVVRLDLPASKMGVDIFVNKRQKLKHKENDQRVRRHGAAFERGEAARITDVRVKKKFIEILLEGGGYGVRGDEKTRRFRARDVEITEEEENLREELPYLSSSTPQTKILVEETLAQLQAERDAEYQRRIDEAQNQQEEQNTRVRAARLAGGSRINIRFGKKIPASALTPEGLMALLDGYVDFSPGAVAAGQEQREARERAQRADAGN